MESQKINVRGISFDNVTMEEALTKACELISREGFDAVFTPNSEIVQACIENPSLYDVINSASLIIPDGIGVVYASRILRKPLKQKVAGIELAAKILEYASKNSLGVYLFGSSPENDERESIAHIAGEKLKERYPGLIISGIHDGYFKPDESDRIIDEINSSGARILFVCLGAPKQEKWIYDNSEKLRVSLAAGLGGSLDVFAGNVKRAPDFFVKSNLEWFYRLICQPSRIGRMMKLPKFLIGTIFAKKEN